MHEDLTTAVAEDGDDEADVDTAAAAHTCPLPPSLRAMMETIMTTQATHGSFYMVFLPRLQLCERT